MRCIGLTTSLFAIDLSFFCWKSSSAVIRWEIVGVKGESANNLSKTLWPRNFSEKWPKFRGECDQLDRVISWRMSQTGSQSLQCCGTWYLQKWRYNSANVKLSFPDIVWRPYKFAIQSPIITQSACRKYKSSFPSSPVGARNRLWASEGYRKWEQMVSKIFGRQIAFR